MDDIHDLSARQHGVFSVAQARRAGFSRSAIRHRRDEGIWISVAPRVLRVRGTPITPRSTLMAAVLSSGDDTVVSHESAAALFGLPGFALLPPHVTVLRRPRDVPGTTVHQTFCLPPHHRAVVAGIPVTSLARVLFDLAGHLDPRRAARVLDLALGQRRVTLPPIDRVLADLAERGRDGTALVRELLDARREGYVAPESELEARFVELVAGTELPRPDAQVDLGDAEGWIGRVDFLWRTARLVVELDGAAYHGGLLDQEADRARDQRLTDAGWTVKRLTWDDVVRQPSRTVGELRDALQLAA
jgi:hypothetical protein